MKIDAHLGQVIDWAEKRLRNGAEPPWTYHKLKLLVEVSTDLLAGLEATAPMESLQPSELHQDDAHPQSGQIVRIDTARRHHDTLSVVLPT